MFLHFDPRHETLQSSSSRMNIEVLLMIRNFVTVTLLWISLDSLGILSSGTSYSSPQYSSLFPCFPALHMVWGENDTFLGRFIPCLVLRMNPSADEKSPVVGKTASGAYRWIHEKKRNTERQKRHETQKSFFREKRDQHHTRLLALNFVPFSFHCSLLRSSMMEDRIKN